MKKIFRFFIQEISTVFRGLELSFHMILDISGLTHVLRKFLILEDDGKKYPSGPIWVIGIYFAIYQVAVLNYQGSVAHLERTVEQISVGVLDDKNRDYWLGLLPGVQRTKTIIKPKIWEPELTIQSFLGAHAENPFLIQTLIGVIESLGNNDKLKNANLEGANLQWANLKKANLKVAYLKETNLKGADLKGADLERTSILLKQLQSARVFKNTGLPGYIDRTKIKFEDE
jgi:hypothetical protein